MDTTTQTRSRSIVSSNNDSEDGDFVHSPDIMDELAAIRSTITECIPGPQHVILTFRLERLYLNAFSATHIYVDSETAAGKEEFDRLPGGGIGQSASSSKVVHAQNIESLAVSKLNQFIITADPQEGVQVLEAALPEAVALGSDARVANTCEVAEQATIADGSLPGRLAAAKEQVALEENAPKKYVG